MTIPTDGNSQRSDGLRRKKSVDRLFTSFRRATTLLATGLALLFAWVKLKNLPMPSLADANPLEVLHFFLALGFASYIAAVSFEVRIHQSVYVDDPQNGRLTPDIAASMILMTAGAALLFWSTYSEAYFPAAVIFFIFTDLVLWRRTLRRFKAMIRSSKAFYGRHELFELEKLNVLEHHVGGKWRWYRFAATFCGAVILCAVSYASSVRALAASGLHALLPALPLETASALAPVLTFGVVLTIVEVWVWIVRFRLSTCMAIIDDLRRRYQLTLLGRP
ncbi:hypothetical protein ABIA85_005928 [Bradyrhizobium sp. LA6.10]|jgi:hypothetical protein|uniref:hypothetical protein n=1 Tax=Bradyrhizobium sp. LA6.10 TaxID=3156318 RepID=UPI003394F01A